MFSAAIIRVLTFEELSLTHTCCYRIRDEVYGRFTRPTVEEAQDIRAIDREDIALLDRLMEEFEDAWAQYPGNFAKFLKKVWKPRMRQERRKRKHNEQLLREAGVILEKVPSEMRQDQAGMRTVYRRDVYISESEDDDISTSNGEESDEEDEDGYMTAAEEE
ncbi:hypothetical protein T440DRAFT_476632 [Plenodomus tracheiphilus IPT5]|uniref:Uncharacterized protein n=1 Tax=Plenodomus tracheiphilus IPT5 TaxID=1408161 RepID=A0A6A7BGY1_9PLEO|nr:hypothetical protein T440DRAFT_476632 [Plenodomus tracheiphilus IPT5]